MARRKQSVFQDLVELGALLPWWVCVGLALGTYIGLHRLAVMDVVAPTGTAGISDFIGKQLIKTFSSYLQYIVPALLLIGAVVSAVKRQNRKSLHGNVWRNGHDVTGGFSFNLVTSDFANRKLALKGQARSGQLQLPS